jgi:hypothetical protein
MNLEKVEAGEKLGRGVFDSSNANSKKPRQVRFFEDAIKHGAGRMSVDRLTYADLDVLRDVHDDVAAGMGENRKFYGWLGFTSDTVRKVGLDAEPSPSADVRNVWHADVLFPDFDRSRSALILRYANALYSGCAWEPLPLGRLIMDDIEQASGEFGC